MQLTTFAAAAALVATVSAATSNPSLYNGNSTCDESSSKTVRVFNRCSYKVYLWSVLKGQGCPSDDAAVIEPGSYYAENYRDAYEGSGVSLKLSKTNECKGVDIAQLEYYIDTDPTYGANYLDMSYVDCTTYGNSCPTAQEGYYLKSGNVNGEWTANSVNEICPVLSCDGWDSCKSCSYVDPNDRQTKSCNADAPLDLYMCAPGGPDDEGATPSSSAAASSSEVVSSSEAPSSTPEPSSSSSSSSSTEPSSTEAQIYEAAITSAPSEAKAHNVKTQVEVVYVTKFEYVNGKRDVHRHGHRHQHFKA